jgi:hypothetical protein
MKWSKKDEARWAKRRKDLSDGHSANNLEQDRALEALKKKLSQPETLAVLKRMKDR